MQIDVTVSGPAGRRDVRIVAPAGTPTAQVLDSVLPGIRALGGGAPEADVWQGERRLGSTDLVAGSVLAVGAPMEQPLSSTLALQVVGGPAAGRIVPLGRGRFTIGRAESCDVVLPDDGISRRHAQLEVTAGGVVVRDLGSTNGTSVDGTAVEGEQSVAAGQLIGVGESLLAVSQPASDRAAPEAEAGSLPAELRRPPPPATQRASRTPWVAWLAPALVGSVIAWATHSVIFLLLAVLSPVAILAGVLGDRLHLRRSHRRERASYARDLAGFDEQTGAALRTEAARRRRAAPDPTAVSAIISARSARLWERRPADAAFLRVRIGTASLDSTVQVRDDAGSRPAGVLRAVPLCVDLRAGPLAVVGPAPIARGLARWIAAQLAAFHSPGDLVLVLLLSPSAASRWTWARWFPHLETRVAVSPQAHREALADIARAAPPHADPSAGPWTLAIVDLDGTAAPGLDRLVAGRASAVWLGTGDPPGWCPTVAAVGGDAGSSVRMRSSAHGAVEGVLERVDREWAEQISRSLASVADPAGRDRVPQRCDLLELLGVSPLTPAAIVAAWGRSSSRADTVLGAGADGPVRIDLDADGPHALIAGTTGSGKSHLLRCLVAGLAALHPPDELNVLLIDYKGGAAFADCARLPHTVGVVTDLDAQLTRRALQSLDAELRRRERLLAAVDAADLTDYRARAPDRPLAKLIIVVDEFATLADELPAFVPGLVSVAQRGRSLGVHLVLATQRPGTAVTPEIRANTSLRIALRVTGTAESADIVDAPDAAGIARASPGRGVLRRGDGLLTFQTAGCDAVGPDASARLVLLDAWRRPEGTAAPDAAGAGFAALADAVVEAAVATGRGPARAPWCPPLPALLRAADVGPGAAAGVAIGLVDLPHEQAQRPVCVDLDGAGSLLVVGAPHTGRTTALVALALGAAAAHSPAELAVYTIDTAGGLTSAVSGLPHLATHLGPGDLDLVPALLARLGSATGSRALLLVDGWDSLLAYDALGEVAAGLDEVLRAGRGRRLTVAAAGSRTVLGPRHSGTFATRVLLHLADRSDYALAGVSPADVLAVLPPGRGLRATDGALVQILAPDDALRAAATRWNEPLAAGVVRLRPLPGRVTLAELAPSGPLLTLGVGGDDAEPIRIPVHEPAVRLLVAGPPRSGRSSTLVTVLAEALRLGCEVVAAGRPSSPLVNVARRHGVRVLCPGGDVGPPPAGPALLVVDDADAFTDDPVADVLARWLRDRPAIAAVVAVSVEDLATAYRGLAAEVRREHRGLLLDPGPADGELLGVRLPRRPRAGRAGRGVLVGVGGAPVPIQVALSEAAGPC